MERKSNRATGENVEIRSKILSLHSQAFSLGKCTGRLMKSREWERRQWSVDGVYEVEKNMQHVCVRA